MSYQPRKRNDAVLALLLVILAWCAASAFDNLDDDVTSMQFATAKEEAAREAKETALDATFYAQGCQPPCRKIEATPRGVK